MKIHSDLLTMTPLQFIPHNLSSKIPLILLLNSISTNISLYYYISLLFKLVPLLILSSNFKINQETKTITKYLRYLTSCGLSEKFLNGTIYIVINIIILLFEFIYFGFIIKYIIKFKKTNKQLISKKSKISYLFIALFHINHLLFPQIVEYLLIIIYSTLFKEKFNLFDIPFNKNVHIVLCIVNIVFIVLLNVNSIMTYLALNFPFYSKHRFSLKLNLNFTNFLLIMIINNFVIIESVELYITTNLKINCTRPNIIRSIS